jgi:murein DD-endopeptidase MepM/ murein hydrolase activator NlpD
MIPSGFSDGPMIMKSVLRRWAILITLVYLIPALACNFPSLTERSDSIGEFHAALTALANSTIIEQPPIPIGEEAPATPSAGGNNTATPPVSAVPPLRTPGQAGSGTQFVYFTQTGDTLLTIAKRFGVEPEEISSFRPIAPEALLPLGLELLIPNVLGETQFSDFLLPDSEIIYSPTTIDFQIGEFINDAGGYLSTYSEVVNGNWISGVEIVQKVAVENSINPRLLLSLLEFRSGWVFGKPVDPSQLANPIGFFVPDYKGLYYELVLTATHLGLGYYGWRTGSLTSLTFPDDSVVRISPGINAGSVALQNFFSKLSDQDEWRETLYGRDGFIPLHQHLYGDPWVRDVQAGPIFPTELTQPELELPFAPGERWSFTGGPHLSWNSGSPRGAIDFSPVTGEPPCTTTNAWVTASASGRVTRSADNVVAIDLDSDGYEQTGWVLVYLHISEQDSISPEEKVDVDQQLGHPSCERGNATGTNVHIARKYNGEWIAVDGFLPFTLSGWEVEAGQRSYQGRLIKDGQVVTANPGGPSSSLIIRED